MKKKITKQLLSVISDLLQKNVSWNYIVILFGLILIFNLVLFPLFHTTNKNNSPLDIQFSYSEEKAYNLLEKYTEKERNEYFVGELTVDFVYPIIYGLFICFLIYKLSKKTLLSLFPLLIIISDYLENIGIVIILKYYPHKLTSVVKLTSLFTSLIRY